MKSSIASQHFANKENIVNGVIQWLKTLATSFFRKDMEKLIPRYKKCIELNGGYVEKQFTC